APRIRTTCSPPTAASTSALRRAFASLIVTARLQQRVPDSESPAKDSLPRPPARGLCPRSRVRARCCGALRREVIREASRGPGSAVAAELRGLPIRQKPASFNLDLVMQQLSSPKQ